MAGKFVYHQMMDGAVAPWHQMLTDEFGVVRSNLAPRVGPVGEVPQFDLEQRGLLDTTMVVAVGDFMRQLAANANDGPKAEALFVSLAGRDATAELRRLADDPVVKEFVARGRNRTAVEHTQIYLDNIERALRLSRIQTGPTTR